MKQETFKRLELEKKMEIYNEWIDGLKGSDYNVI